MFFVQLYKHHEHEQLREVCSFCYVKSSLSCQEKAIIETAGYFSRLPIIDAAKVVSNYPACKWKAFSAVLSFDNLWF